jgi:thiosulfate/3-mercaptopyruvate sulfurtransferase
MTNNNNYHSRKIAAAAAVCALFAVRFAIVFLHAPGLAAGQPGVVQQGAPSAKPSQGAPSNRPTSVIVEPAELAKELAASNKPIIVCVGVHALFEGAHVPGAIFHGPASSTEGLDDLKKWAKDVPKSSNIVLYCGCCPLTECPNARPALMAMRQMGFTHVRALKLPTDFKTDWIDKGFPIEKGK